MEKGVFITFEGIDGCGKTTMQGLCGQLLESRGKRVLLTKEPGDSDFGRSFRQMLLHTQMGEMNDATEVLLYAADRARHVDKVIRPALAQGMVVLCDRYLDSTIAYQGGGRGVEMDLLWRINDFATGGLSPDLTFYLRLDVEQMASRLSAGKDRLEKEAPRFFARVARAYEDLAARFPHRFVTVDANRPPEEVFSQIERKITEFFSWS
ncbi:MAG: dTMP kinase [Firmicutes bacterium]|nr:dTMP kinase [Bacillota bacterium]